MAAADSLRIRIVGQGGHAARPEQGVDPLLVASHIHVALQSIVSRNVDPIASAVISVTRMDASDNEDVIAPEALMAGTVRTVDEAVRDLCEARIRAVAEHVAQAHGALAEVDYLRDYPVTVNHPDGVARVVVAASGVGPVDADTRPIMVSEDFSFMLRERPGAFGTPFSGRPSPGRCVFGSRAAFTLSSAAAREYAARRRDHEFDPSCSWGLIDRC